MTGPAGGPTILALDPGVRETGWAVFRNGAVADSGVFGLKTRQKLAPSLRIGHLLRSLEDLAGQWLPGIAVQCRVGGINWPVPALEQLEQGLSLWAEARGVSLVSYTTQEVRSAVTGRANASKDRLGYAIMLQLGLIGQSRTTREWAAIAVGYHHLRIGNGE